MLAGALPAALLLDLGEVLVHAQPPEALPAMAARAGCDPGAFRAAYWRHRRDYDGDGRAGAYWARVLADCGRPAAGDGAAALLADLVRADVASWTRCREEVWALAARWRAGGGRLGLLSNTGPEVIEGVRALRPDLDGFHAVVASWEVGLLKPDPAIYRAALERLGAAPAETLFVDDRLENLEGAARAGLRTLHFTGDGSAALLASALGL